MSRKKTQTGQNVMIYIYLLLAFGVIAYLISGVFNGSTADQLLASGSRSTKAVIIDEKNYLPNSPVSHSFFYYYQFMLNGKTYKGCSGDHNLKPGDSILIKYAPANPDVNTPASY
ncbi:hypothetical protein HQ865_16235 [Mucilaginibacter mali]|uniref:DUF3592 domain-containing protein n=1 Tax=Mucilaginibacter mali TaxID=2740462 RepID=A0A7D4UE51_9SPHI|nr:hypothetical protein [Mucilaginibacter mali]QKJ31239.1 hypothetical protein HQ865_16235 [Mucilaginibacter mali]